MDPTSFEWHSLLRCSVIDRRRLSGTLLSIVAYSVRALNMRYAAARYTAIGPDGIAYDVLVHRDGVPIRTVGESVFGSGLTTAFVSLFHRWRRGPWLWVVRVRLSPYRGYADLLRETLADRETAIRRAEALCSTIVAGERLWTIEPI
jgi:hypothetical protein